MGIEGGSLAAAMRLAAIGQAAGAGGVVCSPLEVAMVRQVFPSGVHFVPGVRIASSPMAAPDDQARASTPAQAVSRGADRIVVGRPITMAADPVAVAERIALEIERGART